MFDRLERWPGWWFSFGDPTVASWARVIINVLMHRQVALSVRWDSDDTSHDVQVKVGPIHALITINRRRLTPVPEDPGATLKRWSLPGGREAYLWLNWRHLGFSWEWLPKHVVRAELGPLGVAFVRR